MKKFFICAMTSLCSTFAFAQTGNFIMSDAVFNSDDPQTMTVLMENPSDYTAFQFDLTLPKGISVKDAKLVSIMAGEKFGEDRKLEKNLIDEKSNKYRFLSYDMKNAKFFSGTQLEIIVGADTEAEEGEITLSEGLLVDPEGNSVEGSDASDVIIKGSATITIPAGLKLAMVSNTDLDFSSLESKGVKAYICTGYEIATKTFWMTRVNDVPANTPILVKAETAGDYSVPATTTRTYYPTNFLVGSATEDVTLDKSGTYLNYGVSKGTGAIGAFPDATTTFEKGKAYFQVPASVASNIASGNQSFTMGKDGKGSKLLTVNDYDLDFTSLDAEGLKAYTVTGFDFDRTIWLSRVMTVPAGTPILLRGDEGKTYSVPSKESKVAYVNMLDGNTSSEAVTLSPETDGSIIYVMSLSTGVFGTLSKDASMVKGKAWLPVPSWFVAKIPATSRGMGTDITEEESEVIVMKAIGSLDDETTSIRAIEESQNETWYNLNGQRIDTPTKKGLYIKNGMKVIVK